MDTGKNFVLHRSHILYGTDWKRNKKETCRPLGKESPIKDEIYPWGAARKTGLQKETPANSPVIANSPLQNTNIPSPQKQLRPHKQCSKID